VEQLRTRATLDEGLTNARTLSERGPRGEAVDRSRPAAAPPGCSRAPTWVDESRRGDHPRFEIAKRYIIAGALLAPKPSRRHLSDTIHFSCWLRFQTGPVPRQLRDIRAREESDHRRNHPTDHRFLDRLLPAVYKGEAPGERPIRSEAGECPGATPRFGRFSFPSDQPEKLWTRGRNKQTVFQPNARSGESGARCK